MRLKSLGMMLVLFFQPLACGVQAEIKRIAFTSVYVTNLDRAKDWYTQKLGFVVAEDSRFGPDPSDRWLTVRATGDANFGLLLRLGRPVGHQIHHPNLPEVIFDSITDDLLETAAALKARGVTFAQEPTHMPWGVFEAMIVDQDGQGIAIAEEKPDAKNRR